MFVMLVHGFKNNFWERMLNLCGYTDFVSEPSLVSHKLQAQNKKSIGGYRYFFVSYWFKIWFKIFHFQPQFGNMSTNFNFTTEIPTCVLNFEAEPYF